MTALTHTPLPSTEPSRAGSLRTRAAGEDDRDFLRSLFTSTLSPFYDGDHAAHADRVLDAHLASGRDPLGHFSHSQRTFILCSDDTSDAERLGVLHMAVKRQGTVKISPLILVPEHRSRSGLGTLLLRAAEDFAREAGARQLYCTVAAANTAALNFFLGHGFVLAGSAPGQYKPDSVEHMLYKDLALHTEPSGDDRTGAVSGTRIRPFRPQDAPGLRELVLRAMQPAYRGVNADWVGALIAGHHRRHDGDPHQKSKVIHVAVDETGTLRGVAAAGRKKGLSVKVMPLCADHPAVLAQLLDQLPDLHRGLGRKLYTHQPPDPAVTALMQSRGWSLEGLMPTAYHPDTCTVQWGLILPPAPHRTGDTHE
ncbi:acetyltransferase (GNAT) family protein [Streptomyces puniciscabiei]|uniref:Acetyltransferase (GNAT) family protein n=1 Tax=Streptomyces puniciscabiei TaxID=164348 RepID=A0A542UEF0_9ACTN|nr:GNAT family N-acetyltransferase [Streptomyces puniciscabiei]TQK97455.1 acetyltransferase (GNAT) family protein [Streptomyces puniciscabiei]